MSAVAPQGEQNGIESNMITLAIHTIFQLKAYFRHREKIPELQRFEGEMEVLFDTFSFKKKYQQSPK